MMISSHIMALIHSLRPLLLIILISILISCSTNDKKNSKENEITKYKNITPENIDISKPYLNDKGIGPIKSITLDKSINHSLAGKGLELYKTYCSACHKLQKKYIGPPLKGILNKRSPEWVMNMILNPEEMQKNNDLAKAIRKKYPAPMANQNLKEHQARAILEFLRSKNNE